MFNMISISSSQPSPSLFGDCECEEDEEGFEFGQDWFNGELVFVAQFASAMREGGLLV